MKEEQPRKTYTVTITEIPREGTPTDIAMVRVVMTEEKMKDIFVDLLDA